MSLKWRYIIYIVFLHSVLAWLVYTVFKEQKEYFVLSEVLIFVSLLISYWLFKLWMKPSELSKSGTSAIKSKDFTIKYVATGVTETDNLIDIYNTMIDNLRIEQTKSMEQSYFLEKLIQASPIGMITLDYEGNISDINPIAKGILGVKGDNNLTRLSDYNHPIIAPILQLERGESEIVSPDGHKKYKCQIEDVVHKGFPRKFIMIEDLTAEILKSEKEAYGKVIRMMAHEVNNSLGAINSIINTVTEYGFDHVDADPELKESLDLVIIRNKSLAKFIDNFADIIRLPQPSFIPFDINKLVSSSAKAWEAIAQTKGIDFTYNIDKNVFIADIDPSQIERVITNGIKNAIESIETNGQITISTNAQQKSIKVIDNGPGIEEQIKQKLFSPFFSTKADGQGIGLMLSKEIIDNHKGELTLSTGADGLTVMEVVL